MYALEGSEFGPKLALLFEYVQTGMLANIASGLTPAELWTGQKGQPKSSRLPKIWQNKRH